MINEAIDCVYEGLATPDDVDRMMKLGANHPMGPAGAHAVARGDGENVPPLRRQYVERGATWLRHRDVGGISLIRDACLPRRI